MITPTLETLVAIYIYVSERCGFKVSIILQKQRAARNMGVVCGVYFFIIIISQVTTYLCRSLHSTTFPNVPSPRVVMISSETQSRKRRALVSASLVSGRGIWDLEGGGWPNVMMAGFQPGEALRGAEQKTVHIISSAKPAVRARPVGLDYI